MVKTIGLKMNNEPLTGSYEIYIYFFSLMQFLLKSKKSLQIENEFMCEKMWKTANHIPGKKIKRNNTKNSNYPQYLKTYIHIWGM